MELLGIDIGSYGIKGCIVDTARGEIISDRYSTDPLDDTSPHKILSRLYEVVKTHFNWNGPLGCAFPAPVRQGIVMSAKRIAPSWADADAQQLMGEITDLPVTVINDTDAAGLAEMAFGAGVNQQGMVVVLTVGRGIGSSIFYRQRLLPNTELGHMRFISGDETIEQYASNNMRKKLQLSDESWARRLQQMLEEYERIFHPNLFILGGQLSQRADQTFPYIKINTKFKAARFLNDASIVGAAMAANQQVTKGNL